MILKGVFVTLLLLFGIVLTISATSMWTETENHFHSGSGPSGRYNVRNYGALGDGRTDDSKAFLGAWHDACHGYQGEFVTLVVPNSVFLLSPVEFEGPCRSPNIIVKIIGTIVAPNNYGAYGGQINNWLQFSYVNGLTITGGGTIDGRGSIWWNRGDGDRPTALRFHGCNGLRVRGTKHLNSQRNHISLDGCNKVDLFYLKIQAPEDSPNTDGIDISDSTNINIRNSSISTGDDCIAINSRTSNLNITFVHCGPGHGISVGSLGRNGADDSVEQVRVRNCNFSGTQNGVRIKTWRGWTGYVRDITFEGIFLKNSRHPIIIDQNYGAFGLGYASGRGQISGVTYRNIRGTSADEQAISLDCCNMMCTSIVVENVHITSSDPHTNVVASCSNAQGTQAFASPAVPCLSDRSHVHWTPLD